MKESTNVDGFGSRWQFVAKTLQRRQLYFKNSSYYENIVFKNKKV